MPPTASLILAPTSGTGTGTWTFVGVSAPGTFVRVSLVSGPPGTATPAGPLPAGAGLRRFKRKGAMSKARLFANSRVQPISGDA